MARLRKNRRRIVWLLILLTYGALMLFGGCANRLLLFPTVHPAGAGEAHRVMIDAGDARTIECWVDRSPAARRGEPAAFVIEFTGNATRAEYIASFVAARWGDKAVECWTVNYPGYGQSTGPAKLDAIASAALKVYDHVAREAKGRPILGAGNSLGTTAALYMASQRPCAGLVLQNPPAIRSLILRRHGWWNLWLIAGPIALQVPKELDGPTHAAMVKAPAIFALADDDELVVPSNQALVVKAYAGPVRIVHTTGGHNGLLDSAAERQFLSELDWLWAGAGLAAK